MVDLKKCRLCLGSGPVGFSILNPDTSAMVESLTSIKVFPDDKFSTVICTKCLLNVRLAFRIQQNFILADRRLREAPQNWSDDTCEIKHTVILKSEPNSDDDSGEIILSTCMICGINVKEKLLQSHIQQHFQQEQICDLCDKPFDNWADYRDHMRIDHLKVCYNCQICSAKFQYKSLYNVHVKTAHLETKLPKNEAEQEIDPVPKSVSPVNLKKRAILMALEAKQNKTLFSRNCEVCQKTFFSQHSYKTHTYSHIREECPICKASVTKPNLKKHIMNHTSKAYICELCGATLKNMDSYRGHMFYTHSKKQLKCDECGKIFRRKYIFELHKRKDHGGEKTHMCDTCGKGFYTLHRLNVHDRMTHLKARPYLCQYCKKGFSSKNALKTHVRQHTNETPYKCEVCGDGFRQNVSLRTHRKSKHGIIEEVTCVCKDCGKEFASDQALKSHEMKLHS